MLKSSPVSGPWIFRQTLRLELRNTRKHLCPPAPSGCVCRHLQRGCQTGSIAHHEYFYHPLEGPPDERIRKNTLYPLELVFPGSDNTIGPAFSSGLSEHLNNPRNNFALHSPCACPPTP
nr:hypothetical protein [Candidatus Electrothrix aestuarii]